MSGNPSVYKGMSIWKDAVNMLAKAGEEGVETPWDRLRGQQPQCSHGERGLCCRLCTMGPCRFSTPMQRGVCGADCDAVVSWNFARFLAGGAAAYGGWARQSVQGLAAVAQGGQDASGLGPGSDVLHRMASGCGIGLWQDGQARGDRELAAELADLLEGALAGQSEPLTRVNRYLARFGTATTPFRGVDREIAELLYQSHMWRSKGAASLLHQCLRTALAVGWGSLLSTEVNDILFGVPQPNSSTVNLGVLRRDQVNVLLQIGNPALAATLSTAANQDRIQDRAHQVGATGINLAGLGCPGNGLMMRRSLPLAGNHLMAELAVISGVVDLVISDQHCIMPGLLQVAACYHTGIALADAAEWSTAGQDPGLAAEDLLLRAIEQYTRRDPLRVRLPVQEVRMMTGWSLTSLSERCGGTLAPLAQSLAEGRIRGVVAMFGCNNPKVLHDHGGVMLARS